MPSATQGSRFDSICAQANLYRRQLHSGAPYSAIKPTYAIWLLDQTLRDDTPDDAHGYRMRDDQGQDLPDHGGILIFELNTFAVQQVDTEQERWLKFVNEGETLDDEKLPERMQTAVMRQAKKAERQAKESALQAKEAERQAKETALAEVARLKALLNQPRDA
ncbi:MULTISPECIES: PD-(D/E)XK nuclease family transposase [unclassified Thiocapsa]|uniref:PD-(D/E)XK nuclease family transposase n=1 Tax=unclassified Thiocapsa TaxID=2641286 RepID=UPI0035B4B957